MCKIFGNAVNLDSRERALEAFKMSVDIRYGCVHIKMDQLMRKTGGIFVPLSFDESRSATIAIIPLALSTNSFATETRTD